LCLLSHQRHQSELCGWAAGLRAAEAALGRPAPARQPGRRAAAALPRLPHRQPGRGRGTRSGVPVAAHSVQEVLDVLVRLLPPRLDKGHPSGLGKGPIADDTFLLHCHCLLRCHCENDWGCFQINPHHVERGWCLCGLSLSGFSLGQWSNRGLDHRTDRSVKRAMC
jgi:hypothetical protein